MSKFSKFLYLDRGSQRTADLSINTIESAGVSLKGASAGSLLHKASDSTADHTLIWPSAQGSASTFLTNDGAGQLAWTPIPTSSATISNTFKAGQSFSANTSYVVRWGINALSETTDRVYAADFDTTSYDEFWAFGIAFSPVGVVAGDDIHIYSFGIYNLAAGDVPFTTADIGNPVWLGSAGAMVIGAPSGNLEADLKVGIVVSPTQVWIDGQMMGVGTSGAGSPGTPMPIDEGGTGAATQQGALNNLLGIQSAGVYILRSDGTNMSVSAIQASDIPTLNQNTTGTAANITATSNSTLTSLPNLAVSGAQVSGDIAGKASNITGNLLGSQVSGDIAGKASNITATSNSTLTSLPSLSLPGSQVSGNISGNAANVTGTVAIANGGTGATTAAAALQALAGAIYDQKLTIVASGATGNQINGPVSAGTAVTLPNSGSYTASELQVYLNGQLLFIGTGNDWQTSGAGPSYTALVFGDNLQVGDTIHFVKLRSA